METYIYMFRNIGIFLKFALDTESITEITYSQISYEFPQIS